MNGKWAHICALLLLLPVVARAEALPRKELTVSEAGKLAQLAIERPVAGVESKNKAAGVVSRPISLDPLQREADPRFYLFDAWMPGSPSLPGSGHIGAFGVNRRTGDVWILVGCKQVRFRSLSKQQRRLRNRLGVSAQEYRSIESQPGPGPDCDER
jgi:hypothetical protein